MWVSVQKTGEIKHTSTEWNGAKSKSTNQLLRLIYGFLSDLWGNDSDNSQKQQSHKRIQDMQKHRAVAKRASDVASGGVSSAPVRQSTLDRPDRFQGHVLSSLKS